MDSRARLHCELTGFLLQHCPVRDQRHLVLLGWVVAGFEAITLLADRTFPCDELKQAPVGLCDATAPGFRKVVTPLVSTSGGLRT